MCQQGKHVHFLSFSCFFSFFPFSLQIKKEMKEKKVVGPEDKQFPTDCLAHLSITSPHQMTKDRDDFVFYRFIPTLQKIKIKIKIKSATQTHTHTHTHTHRE